MEILKRSISARIFFYAFLVFAFVTIYNLFPVFYAGNFFSQTTTDPRGSVVVEKSNLLPTKLIIPKIGLEAKIIPVGIDNFGNMENLPDLKKVGWYKYGAKPGETGNSTINGHEVDTLGFGAVFKNLYLLKEGDEILIETEKGEKIKFLVKEKKIYDYKNAPLEKIFGKSNERNLNLITCEGNFLRGAQTKNKRLVVFATAEHVI